ncbi:head maturation protease, ClpP-related [Leptotrichia wadei]|uniref:head maturation protease, ClpP-related n=1 Tax=Leptotrichia wadei TaxID=157687 RepID=UPI0020460CAA|nr:head maturation protease, ClpP-related [Leptotrichia wadei]DAI17459.1 MAG TPA: Putative ATP dependent Clp protease [Caudoviricetes sp.]
MGQSIPNHQTMSQRNKTIWNIVKNDDKNAELMLYGDIAESFWGDTISAKEVTEYLADLDVENINVYINSNGGVVDTAIAINNALRRHKAKVTVNIDGIAASAATLITCAGDTVKMPKNALFMIHNPLTIAMGDSEEMRKQADVLEKYKNSIMETYLQKVNIDKEKLSELMDNESWLSAEEALKYGFIDEIIENADIQVVENKVISNNMVFNMAEFKNFNVDKNIKNNGKGSEKMTREEIKNQYPDIYAEIINEGKEIGIKEERTRIQEIENLGYNHEVVDKAKFEEPKNARDLALEIVSLMKQENQNKLNRIQDEGKPLNNMPKGNDDGVNDEQKAANKILAFFKKGGK